jgi:1-acyl-sn-glycerol-3-phosphate acyltransferase
MREAEKLALSRFPKLVLEIVRRYLRVEVEGLENIPRRGRALIAPNHSGAVGFDAAILGHEIHKGTKRIPRILTLWKFFEIFPPFAPLARKVGWVEATTESGLQMLRRNNLLVVFPEGESGSFKPSSERYRLQKFRTGFARMAILTGSPIVPCVITGAEETHINLGTLRFARGIKIPLPFNLLPLPAKWRIRFLTPIDLSEYSKEDAADKDKMEALANRIQTQMQTALTAELKRRPYVFLPTKQV